MDKGPVQPGLLRTGAVLSDSSIGVDRDRNVILGYVVTAADDFKDNRDATDVSIADVSNPFATLASSTRLVWSLRYDVGIGKQDVISRGETRCDHFYMRRQSA